jgi:hypothetical protein
MKNGGPLDRPARPRDLSIRCKAHRVVPLCTERASGCCGANVGECGVGCGDDRAGEGRV